MQKLPSSLLRSCRKAVCKWKMCRFTHISLCLGYLYGTKQMLLWFSLARTLIPIGQHGRTAFLSKPSLARLWWFQCSDEG